jgi:hypothetical protein
MKGLIGWLLAIAVLVGFFVFFLSRIPHAEKRMAIIVFAIVAVIAAVIVSFFLKKGP